MEKIGKIGDVCSGLQQGVGNSSGLVALMGAMRDELDDLRTKYAALLAKIDADTLDTGGDSDYAATCGLAAAKFQK